MSSPFRSPIRELGRVLCTVALAASLTASGALLARTAAAAEWLGGNLTGSVSVYSDYSFRGVSQTDERYAPQYGLDWEHSSGFFMGLWGSRLDYEDTGDHDAFMEQDIIAGFRATFDNFSYDVNVTYFWYPDNNTSPNLNYWEWAVNGSYDFGPAAWSVGALYSPDYFGALDKAYYLQTGLAVPLPMSLPGGMNLTLDTHFGYTKAQGNILSDDDYKDWSVGLVLGMQNGLSVDLRYIDTDENIDLADRRFVAGVTYSF